MAAVGRGQRDCARHCHLQRELCRQLATALLSHPQNEIPIKRPRPRFAGASVDAPAATSPFLDQKVKLSFASETKTHSVGLNDTGQEDPCWGRTPEGGGGGS